MQTDFCRCCCCCKRIIAIAGVGVCSLVAMKRKEIETKTLLAQGILVLLDVVLRIYAYVQTFDTLRFCQQIYTQKKKRKKKIIHRRNHFFWKGVAAFCSGLQWFFLAIANRDKVFAITFTQRARWWEGRGECGEMLLFGYTLSLFHYVALRF